MDDQVPRFYSVLRKSTRFSSRLKVINWLLLEVAKYIDLSGQRLYTTDVPTATAERLAGIPRVESNEPAPSQNRDPGLHVRRIELAASTT